ncbi:multiple C2 and transmembrane domain-containing protein 1-like [Tachypleus tridentatus]|uniref:multiple C2 and transmembrane domain-containing protein 1-like n=1 Tax=Tachypleus tridentatus TaxID=6853 RepID=UPI003FD3EAC1
MWSTVKGLARRNSPKKENKKQCNWYVSDTSEATHPVTDSEDNVEGLQDEMRLGNDTPFKRLSHSVPNIHQATGGSAITEECEVSFLGNNVVKSNTSMESSLQKAHLSPHQYVDYILDIHLYSGHDLIAKDFCGTSDPYVKFKQKRKTLYKSRTILKTLNPVWDEHFSVSLEDVQHPLVIRVFDYDRGVFDDFMGTASIDLTGLELNRQTSFSLALKTSGHTQKSKTYLGTIDLSVTLYSRVENNTEENMSRSSSVVNRCQSWDSILTVVLVEGRDLYPGDNDSIGEPYVKFRLGDEKYRSKKANKTINPKWLEEFTLNIYGAHSKILDITVWDKSYYNRSTIIGSYTLNLEKLVQEKTHRIWLDLDSGKGSLYLLLTISAIYSGENVSGLLWCQDADQEKSLCFGQYNFFKSLSNQRDIGLLTVKVYKARGLRAADFGGKSDPYCVVELVNARLQTHTEYRTLNPEWNKVFTFQVRDIHAILDVSVYDQDTDKQFDFLGKVCIPLLQIRNNEKMWYNLKDEKLNSYVKGEILLELIVTYNPIKACIRTFSPREKKYTVPERKFKRMVLLKNVNRVYLLMSDFLVMAKFVNSCLLWESTSCSILALLTFLVVTYTFQPYMIPIGLLLVFLRNLFISSSTKESSLEMEQEELQHIDEDDDEEEKMNKTSIFQKQSYIAAVLFISDLAADILRFTSHEEYKELKSFKDRIQAVQDLVALIQNILGYSASLGEQCKNVFNFTVPFLSWLAVILLIGMAMVLYIVPFRFIIMIWGLHMFTKKLWNRQASLNLELLDFLSCVPNDEERIKYSNQTVKDTPNSSGMNN